MSKLAAPRVQENSTFTGTGNIMLAGRAIFNQHTNGTGTTTPTPQQ